MPARSYRGLFSLFLGYRLPRFALGLFLPGNKDYFAGGDGGGWTDTIDVSAVAANDPDNPWTVEVDGVQVEYDIAANALELNPDTAGVITFGDGSELSFNGIERIEW